MYRTRIRQVPRDGVPAGKRAMDFIVEVYLGGVGWLPLADPTGRGMARFASRQAARGHAGVVDSKAQVLGGRHLL